LDCVQRNRDPVPLDPKNGRDENFGIVENDQPVSAEKRRRSNGFCAEKGKDQPVSVRKKAEINRILRKKGRDQPVSADEAKINRFLRKKGRDQPVSSEKCSDQPVSADAAKINRLILCRTVFRINFYSEIIQGPMLWSQFSAISANFL
jgi:hypothetical protein